MPTQRSPAQPARRRNSERRTAGQRSDSVPHSAHSSVPLSGKTVMITGGARRVGAEIARTLHTAGANIVLHYRRSGDDAATLAKRLNAARAGSVALVEGDLLETTRLHALLERALAAFGQLNVLVNNASSFYPTEV